MLDGRLLIAFIIIRIIRPVPYNVLIGFKNLNKTCTNLVRTLYTGPVQRSWYYLLCVGRNVRTDLNNHRSPLLLLPPVTSVPSVHGVPTRRAVGTVVRSFWYTVHGCLR